MICMWYETGTGKADHKFLVNIQFYVGDLCQKEAPLVLDWVCSDLDRHHDGYWPGLEQIPAKPAKHHAI